jgi:hypothetical protein
MTSKEELNLWIKNYDILKEELRAAFFFKNQSAIDDISSRLINTQRMIAECIYSLEKNSGGYANNSVGSAIGSGVDVTDYPAMDFGCPDGYWSE